MAAETGFLIDGTIYEVPALDSFTLDEEQVMYELCALVQEDFDPLEGESKDEVAARRTELMRRPGFWAAWMQIAYQRGNPTVKPENVRQLIGMTNRVDAFSTLAGADEEADEVVPLASTSEPSASSENGSLETDNLTKLAPAHSGVAVTTGLDAAVDDPANTGTTRSDTSSISAQTSSAA